MRSRMPVARENKVFEGGLLLLTQRKFWTPPKSVSLAVKKMLQFSKPCILSVNSFLAGWRTPRAQMLMHLRCFLFLVEVNTVSSSKLQKTHFGDARPRVNLKSDPRTLTRAAVRPRVKKKAVPRPLLSNISYFSEHQKKDFRCPRPKFQIAHFHFPDTVDSVCGDVTLMMSVAV